MAGDTDAETDVYERVGRDDDAGVHRHAGGNGTFLAVFGGVSEDGTRVFFETDEQLVAGDTDITFDVYQRAGGTTTLHVDRPVRRQRQLRRHLPRHLGRRGARLLPDRGVARRPPTPTRDRRLRALGRHDDAGLDRPRRQRRLPGDLRGQLRRRHACLLQTREALAGGRHRHAPGHLPAVGGTTDARVDRAGRRQRRFDADFMGNVAGRLARVRPHRGVPRGDGHRHRLRAPARAPSAATCTSAPAGPRPRSPPARPGATARSTPPSRPCRSTASGCSSRRASR